MRNGKVNYSLRTWQAAMIATIAGVMAACYDGGNGPDNKQI